MIVDTLAGGWAIFYRWLEDRDAVARVRFIIGEDGRLEPAEVHLEGHPTVSGDVLRSVPLGSMEAWANAIDLGRERLIESIANDGARVEEATDKWLTTVGGGNREVMVNVGVVLDQVDRVALQIQIPDLPKRPDSFYRNVAELYSRLTASGSHRPASEIAAANDVPVTTVHRWVKEARARGLLGSGRQGKAG